MYENLKHLPGLEYEKIFHLYLINSLNDPKGPVAFRKELKRVMARSIEKVNSFLHELFDQESRK
jgi:hypothetical protein